MNMSEDARNLQKSLSKIFLQQEKEIKAFIARKDVLVNLPTWFGKSPIFQAPPVVHAELSKYIQEHFCCEASSYCYFAISELNRRPCRKIPYGR